MNREIQDGWTVGEWVIGGVILFYEDSNYCWLLVHGKKFTLFFSGMTNDKQENKGWVKGG